MRKETLKKECSGPKEGNPDPGRERDNGEFPYRKYQKELLLSSNIRAPAHMVFKSIF